MANLTLKSSQAQAVEKLIAITKRLDAIAGRLQKVRLSKEETMNLVIDVDRLRIVAATLTGEQL